MRFRFGEVTASAVTAQRHPNAVPDSFIREENQGVFQPTARAISAPRKPTILLNSTIISPWKSRSIAVVRCLWIPPADHLRHYIGRPRKHVSTLALRLQKTLELSIRLGNFGEWMIFLWMSVWSCTPYLAPTGTYFTAHPRPTAFLNHWVVVVVHTNSKKGGAILLRLQRVDNEACRRVS